MRFSLPAPPTGRPRLLVAVGSLFVATGLALGLFALSAATRPGDTDVTTLAVPSISGTGAGPVISAPTGTPAKTSTPRSTQAHHSATPNSGGRTRTTTTTVTHAPAAGKTTGKLSAGSKATTTTQAGTTAVSFPATFLIKNSGTGYCVDLPGYGAVNSGDAATQYPCSGGDSDNQVYEKVGSGQSFLLRQTLSNLCMDVTGAGVVPAGSNLLVFPCVSGDGDNLMFRAQKSGSGFKLINVKSGLCLDVSDADGKSVEPDQPLIVDDCSSSSTQVWTFA
ncbi:ricin-type beta-trefoil lectin domain protein [Kineosporia sp. J2-2]|uniref:Ricin-type beta-trefoil lectin domain protein n=1 Tax=Kineosporia corallincola TaxID=2835133 RepID=A0ABS5TAQ7_9ACTN|nr:RICIN domain-containing protein [Kineosporia corallincola]MBT0768154.1 ricin-type beta-trefoil lectin domain protein [Kineosporia corallincola]